MDERCQHDGMIRKQVQFTERQAARIKREAARRGISESAVIRDALDRGIGPAGPTDEQWERALAVAGVGKGGPPDLAERHDDYLGDALYEEHVEERDAWLRARERSRR